MTGHILKRGIATTLISSFFALCCLAPLDVKAQATVPDASANPVLSSLTKTGARLFYLGNRSGVDGWFIVKEGQVQMAYVPPDNRTAIIGVMFGANGQDITSDQVKALLTTNKEANSLLIQAANQQAASIPAAAPASNSALALPPAGPVPAAAALPPAAAVAQPDQSPMLRGAVAAFQSPGERLITDLQHAPGFIVGNASAPTLYMVMDPDCPHCKATWRLLRDSVMGSTLQIHMIPIGAPNTDHDRAAAQLLHVVDPLTAWDKYIGGDKTQLAGTPDPALLATIHANNNLVDSWHIQGTPFLAYRAKDGKVKVVEGEPDQISTILNDIGS